MSLVVIAEQKELHKDLQAAAGAALHQSAWKEVKLFADKLFPLPTAKDNAPIPAINALVKLKGDVNKGRELFAKVGTCELPRRQWRRQGSRPQSLGNRQEARQGSDV